ncbi:unnamed protein product [Polarella glacialis]|uniref:Chloride channel protein n=1 Tax=Polarella glacialis TaxID=89957 RepID=A0A813J9D5_POLGL|nr:unnamed protein product [Polarella glacialis]
MSRAIRCVTQSSCQCACKPAQVHSLVIVVVVAVVVIVVVIVVVVVDASIPSGVAPCSEALAHSAQVLAAGSGIPEIKCYLNGVKLPKVVGFRTWIAKAVGIVFSVAAGLPCGKEGPMIHSGAIVGAMVSHLNLQKRLRALCVEVEMRDFVAAGACAGVSAAFGAPIGAVLFAVEEGASHMNPKVLTQLFVASATATFCSRLVLGPLFGGIQFGELGTLVPVSFGRYDEIVFRLREMLIFMLMGVCGGLLGALFNEMNRRLCLWRSRHIGPRGWRRFLEALGVTFVIASCRFLVPIFWRAAAGHHLQATRIDELGPMEKLWWEMGQPAIKQLFHAEVSKASAWSARELVSSRLQQMDSARSASPAEVSARPVRLFLQAFEWSPSMSCRTTCRWHVFEPGVDAVQLFRLLWHVLLFLFPKHTFMPASDSRDMCVEVILCNCALHVDIRISEASGASYHDKSMKHSAAQLHCAKAELTYGLGVPSGLFVPSLLTGAAFGRFVLWLGLQGTLRLPASKAREATEVGELLAMLFGRGSTDALSVAAVTVSVDTGCRHPTRLKVGDGPIFATVMIAKWTGDYFNRGIYDLHIIELKHVPILGEEPEHDMVRLKVEDVMASSLVVLEAVETVGSILTKLESCSHQGFPVMADYRLLEGTIQRGIVHLILLRGAKYHVFQPATGLLSSPPPIIPYEAMAWRRINKFPDIKDVQRSLTREDYGLRIDLRRAWQKSTCCALFCSCCCCCFAILPETGSRLKLVSALLNVVSLKLLLLLLTE